LKKLSFEMNTVSHQALPPLPLTPLRGVTNGSSQAGAGDGPTPKRDRPADDAESEGSPPKRMRSNNVRSPFKALSAHGSVKPGGGRSPIRTLNTSKSPERALAEVTPRLRTPNKPSKILENTLMIYDYDDTLFPSSFLSNLNEVYWDTREVPKSLTEKLKQIEDEMVEILELSINLVGNSRVAIITNAEEGWIELSAAKYMPRLLAIMKKCRMLSARSLFSKYEPGVGPFEWKLYAFQFMMEACFGMQFPRPNVKQMKLVPSVGDVQLESVGEEDTHDFTSDTDNDNDKENAYPVNAKERPVLDPVSERGNEDTSTDTSSKDLQPASENGSFSSTTENEEDALGPLTNKKCGRWEVTDLPASDDTQDGRDLSGLGDSIDVIPFRQNNESALWDQDQDANEFKLTGTAAGHNNQIEEDSSIEEGQIEQKVEYCYLPSEDDVEFPDISAEVLAQHGLGYPDATDAQKAEYLRKNKYIFSLGDSLAEKVAAKHLSGAVPGVVVKTVKWVDRPNLEQLLSEAKLIKDELQNLLYSDETLDLSVSVPVYYDALINFQDTYYEEKAVIEQRCREEEEQGML